MKERGNLKLLASHGLPKIKARALCTLLRYSLANRAFRAFSDAANSRPSPLFSLVCEPIENFPRQGHDTLSSSSSSSHPRGSFWFRTFPPPPPFIPPLFDLGSEQFKLIPALNTCPREREFKHARVCVFRRSARESYPPVPSPSVLPFSSAPSL